MSPIFRLTFRHIVLSTLLVTISASSWAQQTLNFGVYAYQSKTKTTQQYQGLSNYLSEQLPNYSVNLKVLNANEIINAVRNKQVDFILVNPNLHQVIRNEVKLNGITATQQKRHQNHILNSLGGVIFSLNENRKIRKTNDLINAKIAIPTFSNTGAFRIPLHELHTQGIPREQLNFIEVGNNDAVIEAVLQGQADVGFVRTGIIENWIADNKISADSLHVINAKDYPSFPQRLSTKLYPEWPFIILPSVHNDLTNKITVALFSLDKDHPALAGSGLAGFTTPQDYWAFENLLRDLQLYPYNQNPLSLRAIWHEYQAPIILSIMIIVLLLLFIMFNELQTRKIRRQKNELNQKNHIDEALLSLPKLAEQQDEKELIKSAVDILEKVALSELAFIHWFDNDDSKIELEAWSNKVENSGQLDPKKDHYPVQDSELCSQVVKEKNTVIINDYPLYQHKNTWLDEHFKVKSVLCAPVIDNNKVVMVAGVANKSTGYSKQDIQIFNLILSELWRLIKEKRYLKTIKKQRTHYQHLLDNLGNDYVVFSHSGQEGILTFVSEGVEKVFELNRDTLINTPWFEKINWDAESIQLANQAIRELINKQSQHNEIVMSFHSPSGKHKYILVQQNGVYEGDQLIAIEGLVTNITQRITSEQNLKQAALVFEKSQEGIMITDNFNRIVRVNNRFTDITGYSENEAIGQNPNFLSSGHQNKQFYEELWSNLLKKGSWKGEIWNRRKNGEAFPQNLSITVIRDEKGTPHEFLAIMADISAEKEQERKLERMAHYDALTGLPNRFLLSDRITQAIEACHRDNRSLAIMFIDLDGFKGINDTHGHEAGDFLLTILAERYKKTLRGSDTISRIGGDEFVVVVSSHQQLEEIHAIEDRLLSSSTEAVKFKNKEFKVSSSIGVVIYEPSEHEKKYGSEQLIRYADQAMYHAKELGKNRVYRYEWGIPKDEFKLKEALEKNQLELFYQPKVNFGNNSAPALEALIRWNHPEKGILPPAAFLHQITTTKNKITLTQFVLNESLSFIQKARQQTGQDIEVSINVDSAFLLQENLVEYLENLFTNKFADLTKDVLTLEILESSALGDMDQVVQAILSVNKLGIQIAIDDFGTGHASLNYLKDLPVDIIKIDQAFVRNIFLQPNNVSILEAISSMAEAFEMEVIAEGVETRKHIELLLQLGIDNLQGYGISRPIRERDVITWLKEYTKPIELINIQKLQTNGKNFLKAKLYHQAWNNKIKEHILHHGLLTKSETTPSSCPFGRWLETKSEELIHDNELLREIISGHVTVHKIANQAISAKKLHDVGLAKNYLDLLDIECEKLINNLDIATDNAIDEELSIMSNQIRH